MNIINVKVDFTRGTCDPSGISLVTGDYNSTKIVFDFDREDGTKVFEMKSPSEELVMVQEITNNEVILYGLDENENMASIFTEDGNYIFEISLYENESKLTSAKGKIRVKPEQVVITDEIAEPYLPVFDQLISEVSTAIAQTNNLNLSSSKSGKITTITITKKDGTSYEVEVLDGEQGPQGEPGPAGQIKYLIVNQLPETGSGDTLYFVPKESPTTQNIYDEWAWLNNDWEFLGEKQIVVDLTDYVKNTDYATTDKGGVIKVDAGYGSEIASSGGLRGSARTYAQYSASNERLIISKGTLENVITGKGLTTKSYVDGLVGDIATALDTINGESVGD